MDNEFLKYGQKLYRTPDGYVTLVNPHVDSRSGDRLIRITDPQNLQNLPVENISNEQASSLFGGGSSSNATSDRIPFFTNRVKAQLESDALSQASIKQASDMNSFIAANPNASSLPTNIDPTGQYSIVNGVLMQKSALTEQQRNEQGVADGSLVKVPVGNGFAYVPKGSAAESNLVNTGTNNTSNALNAANNVSSGQPGANTGGAGGSATGGVPGLGSPTVSGNTITFNGQTYNASSPQEAEFMKNAILPFLEQLQSQGLTINPNLDLGPDIIAKILEKAKTVVRPQYAQQITGVIEDLNRSSKELTDKYQSEIASSQDAFRQGLDTSRENAAGSGTVFSGRRIKDENQMTTDQNRNLTGLSDTYASTLGNNFRTTEKALGTSGMSGFNLPSFNTYSANRQGRGGYNVSGTNAGGYTPGTYKLGSIPQAEEAAALSLRNQNVEEASKRKAAGLSFADLYS